MIEVKLQHIHAFKMHALTMKKYEIKCCNDLGSFPLNWRSLFFFFCMPCSRHYEYFWIHKKWAVSIPDTYNSVRIKIELSCCDLFPIPNQISKLNLEQKGCDRNYLKQDIENVAYFTNVYDYVGLAYVISFGNKIVKDERRVLAQVMRWFRTGALTEKL